MTPGSTGAPAVDRAPRAGPGARRLLVIVNPGARNGAAPVDAALDVLRAKGLEVVREHCAPGRTVSDAIRAHDPAGLAGVVVGGGDGTMNAAAPALVETGLPLGILPLGTANDLARTLGIAPDPVAAAEVIAAGRLRRIDLGEVNGRPFFNVASVGFSADLARSLRTDLKRRWGTLGYAIAAAQLLRRARPFSVEIDHDGVSERLRAIQVSVGNGRHYGGGMTVHWDAEPDDGTLDLYAIEVTHWWRVIALLPALRSGTYDRWRDVRGLHTTECLVHTRRPRPVNADGEIVTETPARFRVVPGAVQVFAPPPPIRPTAPLPPQDRP
ncbi:MAG: lipid kinase [Alphaproteobacteria bacterium]